MFHILPREIESLWTLFTGPVIWAVHFLACYVGAAVACARAVDFEHVRLGIASATAVALTAILLSSYLAWRQWGFETGDPPHGKATRDDRLLFQGFATLLLCALSYVAVAYQALPALFLADCRP